MSLTPGIGCLILVVLLLAGCASMTRVPEALPASEDSPAGDGTAIGSILMSVPTGMSDADKQEMIESLKSRRYQVPFEIGVEKQFVLRAPAGTYSFQTITETFRASLAYGLKGAQCRTSLVSTSMKGRRRISAG